MINLSFKTLEVLNDSAKSSKYDWLFKYSNNHVKNHEDAIIQSILNKLGMVKIALLTDCK